MDVAGGRWIRLLLLLCIIIIIILCEFIPKGSTLTKKDCNDADYAGSCKEGLEKCREKFREYMRGSQREGVGWAFCDYGTTEEDTEEYNCYYCFDPEKQPQEVPPPEGEEVYFPAVEELNSAEGGTSDIVSTENESNG